MLNEIKMNAGKWIVVAFVLFAGFIATLVTICVQQDISLVSKDYYQEELVYQEQIERIQNTTQLQSKPQITVANKLLTVTFDSLHFIDKGEVTVFCPSDATMDRNFKLTASERASYAYSLSGLKSGMYRVKLLWSMSGKEFYQEEIINL
jgi:hypothetical protein